MKAVQIILSPEAEKVYLESKDQTILNAVNRKIKLIKLNFHYGVPITKRLFPREYILRYGITNLFRVELPNFWRMLYTLTDGDNKIIAFILDIIDHNTYNKKFGYK